MPNKLKKFILVFLLFTCTFLTISPTLSLAAEGCWPTTGMTGGVTCAILGATVCSTVGSNPGICCNPSSRCPVNGTQGGMCRATNPKCDGSLTCNILNVCMAPLITLGTGTSATCNLLKTLDWAKIIPVGPAAVIGKLFTDDKEWYNQTLCQFNTKVFDASSSEIFGERYTAAQVNWITNSIIIFLLNSLSSISSNGLLGLNSSTLAEWQPHNQLSFVKWLETGLDKLDLVSPASAQGYGYNTLSTGLLTYWSVSRNLAYLLMIILLIAAGFMIMFRVKINPQTAVTLQLMIPKIILTLVFVTFSFAIAGLVIDLIYVIIGLVVFTFSLGANPVVTSFSTVFTNLTRSDILGIIGYFLATLPFMAIIGGIFIPLIGAILVPIVVLILILRVAWLLLQNYIMLLFQVILAPIQIMLGLLPGQAGFSGWLRNFIATASVFAVVPLMYLAVFVLWSFPLAANDPLLSLIQGAAGITGLALGATPYLPLTGMSPLGSFGDIFFRLIMGFCILALMPKTANMIKDALKIPPFKHGTAFGEALSPVASPIGGAIAARGHALSSEPSAKWAERIVGGGAEAVGRAIGGGRR